MADVEIDTEELEPGKVEARLEQLPEDAAQHIRDVRQGDQAGGFAPAPENQRSDGGGGNE